MKKCERCNQKDDLFTVPYLSFTEICPECVIDFNIKYEAFRKKFMQQPKRSKREDSEYGAKCRFGILKRRCGALSSQETD